MSTETEAAGTESVESLLAFTVDKRQRNAEAASPELRKEAILSNTVRRAHAILSLFDPRRRGSGDSFKGFEHEDELVDVDDELEDQNLDDLSPEEILENTANKDKMAGLIQEMNQLSSIRIKRKRDLKSDETAESEDELATSAFYVPSPRKKGKTLKSPSGPEEVTLGNVTLGKLSLMDT